MAEVQMLYDGLDEFEDCQFKFDSTSNGVTATIIFGIAGNVRELVDTSAAKIITLNEISEPTYYYCNQQDGTFDIQARYIIDPEIFSPAQNLEIRKLGNSINNMADLGKVRAELGLQELQESEPFDLIMQDIAGEDKKVVIVSLTPDDVGFSASNTHSAATSRSSRHSSLFNSKHIGSSSSRRPKVAVQQPQATQLIAMLGSAAVANPPSETRKTNDQDVSEKVNSKHSSVGWETRVEMEMAARAADAVQVAAIRLINPPRPADNDISKYWALKIMEQSSGESYGTVRVKATNSVGSLFAQVVNRYPYKSVAQGSYMHKNSGRILELHPGRDADRLISSLGLCDGSEFYVITV